MDVGALLAGPALPFRGGVASDPPPTAPAEAAHVPPPAVPEGETPTTLGGFFLAAMARAGAAEASHPAGGMQLGVAKTNHSKMIEL